MTNKKNKNSVFYLEPEDDKMIRKVAWKSMLGSFTYNYGNMQALSFLNAMFPVIDRYYDKKEDRIKAYKRHFTLFNITPAMFGFVTGLVASMERDASKDPDHYDYSGMTAVKTALMGPLSGIGDSIFWGSLKVIATGLGCALAATGNILGPILYFCINFFPALWCKLNLPRIAFNMGTAFFTKMEESGLMSEVIKLLNIVGLVTIGAMATTMVKAEFTLVIQMQSGDFALQSVLDGLLPKMLPVLLTLLMYKYVKKGTQPIVLILVLIGVAILGSAIGLF